MGNDDDPPPTREVTKRDVNPSCQFRRGPARGAGGQLSSRVFELLGGRDTTPVIHSCRRLVQNAGTSYARLMRARFQTLSVPFCLALAMLGQGCALGPRVRVPIQLASNPEIVVVRATAHQQAGGLEVGGDVRRTDGGSGRVAGQLRVTGRNTAGEVVASSDAPWGEFMNRRFRLAYFKAILKVDDPSAIAAITVEPITAQRN